MIVTLDCEALHNFVVQKTTLDYASNQVQDKQMRLYFLIPLKEKSIIKRIGPAKGRHWDVKEQVIMG